MSTIDIVLAVILFAFFVLGFMKGLIKTVVQLLALVLTLYLMSTSGHLVKTELISRFSLDPTLATVLAYVVMALVIFIMAKLVILVLNNLVDALQLKAVNRILGGLFGILNACFIFALILVLIEFLPIQEKFYHATKNSNIVSYVRNAKNAIKADLPDAIIPEKFSEELKDKISGKMYENKDKVEDFIEDQIKK